MDESPFGILLRNHRARLLLTQEQLAERAALSVRSIRGFETGRVRAPRSSSVTALAEALKLSEAERRTFASASRSRLGAAREAPPPSSELIELAVQVVVALLGATDEFRDAAGSDPDTPVQEA